jgi:hypothetical protein
MDFQLGALEKCSEKINHNALWGFGFPSAPAAWASPHIAITSHKVNQIAEGGSRGYTPHAATPSGGERGSPSYFLSQRKDEQNQVFYKSTIFTILGNSCKKSQYFPI